MAALLTGFAETGITTGFFVRRRRSDGFWWNTSTVAWQAYSAAQIANYGTAGTEVGVTGIYVATDPDDTTEGDFLFVKAAGASLTVADLTTGLRWQDSAGASASTAPSASAISAQVAADLAAAHGGGSWATADVSDVPTNGELAAALAAADDAVLAAIAGISAATDWTAPERSQIRQALGVTGTVAATTGTGNVDLIKLHTDMLGTGTVTAYAPVSPGGTITITRGDDYAVAVGGHPPLLFTSPTADAWGDLTGSTVVLRFGGVSYHGTILVATGIQQVQFELTDTQTSAMAIGRYRYGITFTRGTDTSTPVKGIVVVD